ncbi:Hypothetical predicted protein [Mytilus galloprovincialis]|uniref:Integrase catalytic domain-containing protein n=1 Tax=Mytilus galloprovincialis TaxID=29158 RepID=A0A8B6D0K9_MYTGA|nr:Hypothetical predicted protein [Mytilus galloprovincialis]
MDHDSPLGGHSGIQNTLDRLRDDFYFPRMGKIVTDYVASCHDCQSRKVTNLKTKAKTVPYRTPSEPFQVWQVDLFGPLKTSPNGNQYLFTASDMFSKYLLVLPIRNKDMLTVSNAVFSLVSQFGVCETLISDQGSEFIGSCTQEKKWKEWEFILPAVVFSINASINQSTKYSPFEVLYGKRPAFPLSVFPSTDLNNILADTKSYIVAKQKRLDTIRTSVKEHSIKAQDRMEKATNAKTNELELSVGDYVYLQIEQQGQGRKFKQTYDGPFVVTNIPSEHLILLRDPNGKQAEVSQSDDLSASQGNDSPDELNPQHVNELRRSFRNIRLPARYQDSDFTNLDSVASETDNGGVFKVKRILAKKRNKGGFLYLVQKVGEPAENAEWFTGSQLPPKAQELMIKRPPPLIE